MKKVLITGANSYIGTSVEKWLLKESENYQVDTIDMQDENWRNYDFSPYDTVFHVAGIAHQKETKKNRDLYYKVNRDLAIETAKKAKNSGVKQFIFSSTMSVYGLNTGIITRETVPNPKSNYGKSKLEAEIVISKLQDNSFKVAILRPPMVYGPGCKGNYSRLSKISQSFLFFPNVNNKRSMIYINNLAQFIKKSIDNQSNGIFFPQNQEYVNTSELVKQIARTQGKIIFISKIFNFVTKFTFSDTINKVFGSLIYEMDLSKFEDEYNICDFNQSILFTEELI